MELYLIIAILILALAILILQIVFAPRRLFDNLSARLDQSDKNDERVETIVREEVRTNRQELTGTLSTFQYFLAGSPEQYFKNST